MADRRRVRAGLAALFAAAVFAGLLPGGASAADSGVTVTTTIDGRPVSSSNDRHPVPLHPKKQTTVNVKVRNDSSENARSWMLRQKREMAVSSAKIIVFTYMERIG